MRLRRSFRYTQLSNHKGYFVASEDSSCFNCYNCQELGHYASDCTNDRVTGQPAGVQLLRCSVIGAENETDEEESEEESSSDDRSTVNFSFNLTDAITLTQVHMINQDWILLDSKLSVSIFSNKKFLENI